MTFIGGMLPIVSKIREIKKPLFEGEASNKLLFNLNQPLPKKRYNNTHNNSFLKFSSYIPS
jgi:hypothetical protein